MRTFVAGVLGGFAMFIWASIAHVATPLASMGLGHMPNEAATMAVLQVNLGTKPGLYFFPALQGRAGDARAMRAQEDALKTGPSGLLAYEPPGTPGLTPRQLITEFLLEIVEALLMAIVLGAVVTGFARRLAAAALIGVIAGMATNFSYWNWYGFSLDYTLANAFIEMMKFVFAGAVIAAMFAWRGVRAR
jgi:hypothetical protein